MSASIHFFVGSDHAGSAMRSAIAAHLIKRGHSADEVGPREGERAEYPDAAAEVSRAVVATAGALGVLVCGTGIGVSIAANKIVGVRAALVHDPITAALACEHNAANVLCVGARLLAIEYALTCVDAWLDATFEPRHQVRIDKIAGLEAGRDSAAS